jgi:4a-hydroxytetrahydrobiopterin dehydratase
MSLTAKHCVPCEGGIPPLTPEQEETFHRHTPTWNLLREGTHRLRKQYRFRDFREAMSFVNRVAEIAEEEGHHPDISISYSRLDLELFTHAVEGLTENDFIVAAKIDDLRG